MKNQIKKTIFHRLVQWWIRIYQYLFSPDASVLFSPRLRGRICRHYPHCSQYGYECFDHYSFFNACFRTMDRISRCVPGHGIVYDPVRYRTVFASGSPIGVPFLKTLLNDPRFEVCGVLTMPDMPVGRGMKLQENIIAQEALDWGISPEQIKKPHSLRIESARYGKQAQEIIQRLQDLDIDILYVIAYGHILPVSVLELPRIAPINIHGSLLPVYRGASPLQQVFLDQQRQTGVTLMRMVSEMDAGPIIDQQVFQLGWSDTVADLIDHIKAHTPVWSLDSIDAYAHGELSEQEQDPSQVSYCTKIAKADGNVMIDPYAGGRLTSLEELYARYRAYFLWPKIRGEVTLHNNIIKKIIIEQLAVDSQLYEQYKCSPLFLDKQYTLNPAIRTLRVKPEGKKGMNWVDFMRGYYHI